MDTRYQQWLHDDVTRGTPRHLPRSYVDVDEVYLQQQVVKLVKQDGNDEVIKGKPF